MGYSVYILKSKKVEKFYIGYSSNPSRRLEFHNSVEKGFTLRYRPWELVYQKEYELKTEALSAERKIKSWKSKEMIKKLINQEIEI